LDLPVGPSVLLEEGSFADLEPSELGDVAVPAEAGCSFADDGKVEPTLPPLACESTAGADLALGRVPESFELDLMDEASAVPPADFTDWKLALR